ncbi:BspA family leucine-rich repeat surface protein [Enterococcus hirae]|nr:BspA family leucine-rich repeat surface protein [Enterococcus hirae]
MKNIRKKILIVFVSSFLINYGWIPSLTVSAAEKTSSTEKISSNTSTSLSSDNNLESSLNNNNLITDQEETSTSSSSDIDTTESTQEPAKKENNKDKSIEERSVSPKKYVAPTTVNGQEWTAEMGNKWLENWNYNTNENKKFICLNYYTGNETSITIPGRLSTAKGNYQILIRDMNQESSNYFLRNNKYKEITSILFAAGTYGNTTSQVGILSSTSGASLHAAFKEATNLQQANLQGLNLDSGTNQAVITDMSNVFQNCTNLQNMYLPTSSHVTNMAHAFDGCSQLGLSLVLGNNFSTSNVTDMQYLFNGCSSLNSTNVGSFNFDASNVINMSHMFAGCTNIDDKFLNNINLRNTNNVQNMDFMFEGCTGLSSPTFTFPTNNVEHMSYMFKDCSNLTNLNIAEFDTAKVSDMTGMFYGCPTLSFIDFSNATVTSSTDTYLMFMQRSNVQYTPLLVIVDGNKAQPLLNYDYTSNFRKLVNSPFLNANGGTFSNGNSNLYYIPKCAVDKNDPILKVSNFKKWVTDNTPTKQGTGFLNWKISGTNPDQANSVLDLLNTEYTAQWMDDPNTSSDNKKIPSSAALSMIYIPSSFNTGEVALKNSGEQSIPLTKDSTFNIGIRDQEDSTTSWRLDAKLTWNSEGSIDNAYLQTTSTSNVKQNINNGVDAYNPSTDLQECSDVTGTNNAKITTVDSTLMSNVPNKHLNGVYDYNLGDVSLILPNVENIEVGNYSATVTWNLVTAP